MKPDLLSCAWLLLAVQASPVFAQEPLPYSTGFDDDAQQAGWEQHRESTFSPVSWDYASGGAPSAPLFLWHDYPATATAADTTCDWFVSPAFDFIEGARLGGLKVSVNSITGVIAPGDELAVYILRGSSDPHAASSAVVLTDLTDLIAGTTDWVEHPPVNIAPVAGECHIAIKYKATNNFFTVSIDDIRVEPATAGVATMVPKDNGIRVLTDVVNGTMTVGGMEGSLMAQPMYLRVFDERGAMVLDRSVRSGVPVAVRVDAGLYAYVISTARGEVLGSGRSVLY